MHNSIEKENPIQDSEDQEILAKLLVEEKKKNPKRKSQIGRRSRFNFTAA